VSRDSPVYSSTGSHDFLVYSSLGSWDSPVYSLPRSQPKLVYKRTLLEQNTLDSQDSSVINTLGSLDSLVYYSPESLFVYIPVLVLVQSTLRSRLPVYSSQGSRDSTVYSSPGSQLQIRITPWIFKKIETFPDMPIGTRRSCLMKKTRDEKSCDTVPLSEEC
jgi:hypothetical protein